MAQDLANETYIVETPECSWCGKGGTVEVPAIGFLQWNFGKAVQEAFPDLDKALREQLKTGYHPKCWTEMFGEH
jgi:hypothetical protein